MANEPPELESVFKNFFASYSSLTCGTPSSWFTWSYDDPTESNTYFEQICHALMRYSAGGADELITAVPKSTGLALDYQRMLIDGPFQVYKDLISLEQMNEFYFIRVKNLDKMPSNVLYNFCIATRVPIERPALLKSWRELRKTYPAVLAFLLASHATNTFSNHFWFDRSADWRILLSGKMLHVSKESYKSSPRRTSPCNGIWGLDIDFNKKCSGLSPPEIVKLLEQKEIDAQIPLPI